MHGRRYHVKPGDSLSSIAHAQLGKASLWPRIFAYNNRRDVRVATRHALQDPDKLAVGQLLLIPPPDHVRSRVSHAADRDHPRQVTRPRIVPHTQPAPGGSAPAPHPKPHASVPNAPRKPTTVNSFPFKYKLELIPKQTIEGPNYIATLSFDGTVTIWLDKQIPVGMVTNKGAEASAKHETDGVLSRLVQTQKISWEPGSNKASYEDMLTLNAHGAPPSLSSVGVAVASDNPIPALRFKFQAPTLQGKLGQHLYVAENFAVTVDLRPKPRGPDITRRPDPVRVPFTIPVPAPQPESWWRRAGHWAGEHKVEIGVGVVVTAVLVSNFFTAGADAEADPAVAAWAARTLQAARAARAAASAFAH